MNQSVAVAHVRVVCHILISFFTMSFFVFFFFQAEDGIRDIGVTGVQTCALPISNTNRMISFAKNMTDDEIKQAAQYFGAIKWSPWIRVVEADTVPKTRIAGGMFLVEEGAQAGKEPIGLRVIETPEKTEDTEMLRNSHSGFIAYVPPGSIKKGEALVTNGAGKTTQCAVCHGANLQGLGPVPGIAGRSPSYLVRQLYDMQVGSRKGEWTDLMKPVVAKLTAEDMINIVAYTASRPAGEARSSGGGR